jgi:hypothetical protein
MKRTLASSLLIVILTLLLTGIVLGQADPFGKPITLTFKNTPFPDALDTLLKGSGISYTLGQFASEPAQKRITAVFQGVPLEAALQQMLRAIGASYRKDGNMLLVSELSTNQALNQVNTQTQITPNVGNDGFQQFQNNGYTRVVNVDPPKGAPDGLRPLHPNYADYETVSLKYVDASAILPLGVLEPELFIARTGANSITIHGRPGVIENFKQVIQRIDTPESLPRSIRITARVEVTGKDAAGNLQPITSRADSESLGIEGVSMPLTISARTNRPPIADPANNEAQITANTAAQSDIDMRIDVTATVQPAAANTVPTISLTGHGIINGHVPMEFGKDFDFAVSTSPNTTQTITQGSVDIGGSQVSFAVNVTANIEKGRVQLPANGIQGGYGGGYGMMGGMGNSYGSYNQGFGNGPGGLNGVYGGMQNQQAFPGNQPPMAPPNGPRPPANAPVQQPVQPPPPAQQQNK